MYLTIVVCYMCLYSFKIVFLHSKYFLVINCWKYYLCVAFSALTLLVGRQEGHSARKKYGGRPVEVGTG